MESGKKLKQGDRVLPAVIRPKDKFRVCVVYKVLQY